MFTKGNKMAEFGEWIKPDEKLPDLHTDILICLSDKTITLGRLFTDNEFAGYQGDVYEAFEEGEVTHWMKLPDPPKFL